MTAYAPARGDGLLPYVVTDRCFGEDTSRIEYAENLTEAKRKYGWSGMRYTTTKVRRARPQDVEAHGD